MAADCVFCMIVEGKIPSHKVAEDAFCFAFLDIKPLAKGHVLVVPKKHYEKLEDMPREALGPLMAATQGLSSSACAAVGAPASTIAINNGKEAGQEVAHVHVHIVPRRAGDAGGPIHALFRTRPELGVDELPALAQRIRGSTRA